MRTDSTWNCRRHFSQYNDDGCNIGHGVRGGGFGGYSKKENGAVRKFPCSVYHFYANFYSFFQKDFHDDSDRRDGLLSRGRTRQKWIAMMTKKGPGGYEQKQKQNKTNK